ncbi:hypothetical protein EJ06DRAFT_513426 [Trichodelitschia bisporula]|uniref:Integral membrane protein n=1 Tax=Trichodelitschia bisporula TaxID=703511 RepID=A0A6G1HQT3_9PEZI|nr:hypothetical protein EJ06DRAFT_513426 [Trichodelitschia bisporula]
MTTPDASFSLPPHTPRAAASRRTRPLRAQPLVEERERFGLQLVPPRRGGPVPWLNATRAEFRHVGRRAEDEEKERERERDREREGGEHEHEHEHKRSDGLGSHAPAAAVGFRWTSRNHRKGRHQLVYVRERAKGVVGTTRYLVPEGKAVLRTFWRMVVEYPWWDVSWLVAWVFTWGSIIWVLNSFFVWLPVQTPSSEFGTEVLYGGGITAFIGATIFEFGSVLLLLEAINDSRTACFGWAVHEVLDNAHVQRALFRLEPDMDGCGHHHSQRPRQRERAWIWWPTWAELRSHYLFELGFLASAFQMAGATVFWVSGFTALPGIYDHMTPGQELGAFWIPQIVGGSGFIISGLLFTLETQTRWWKPQLTVLGWYVGVFNMIGGVGFTLCPIFGLYGWGDYQSTLSTFWGSWAFLIGSTIQLYESLGKTPVDEVEGLSGDEWEAGKGKEKREKEDA